MNIFFKQSSFALYLLYLTVCHNIDILTHCDTAHVAEFLRVFFCSTVSTVWSINSQLHSSNTTENVVFKDCDIFFFQQHPPPVSDFFFTVIFKTTHALESHINNEYISLDWYAKLSSKAQMTITLPLLVYKVNDTFREKKHTLVTFFLQG